MKRYRITVKNGMIHDNIGKDPEKMTEEVEMNDHEDMQITGRDYENVL